MAETAQEPARPDFFISRAGADAAFAAHVGAILEAAGRPVWLQQWDFGSANFMSRIHDGLTSGARVIALISPAYLASDHCLAEALNTIGHDPLNKRQTLIPMRIAECTPDGLFTALAYWDLLPVRGNASSLRDIVLAAVATDRARQAPALDYWRAPRPVLHPAISPVPNFTGRVEDLAKIEAVLWADGAAGGAPAHIAAITQTAAVNGLGGIGKSVLARQYGWDARQRYVGVWSLAAETRAGITEGLIELGARLIPGLDKVEDKAAAARDALEVIADAGTAKPWLLIYDNIERPETMNGLTPRAGAHLLITTRWPRWHGRAEALELGKFSEAEAVAFLLKATGRADKAGAARLAEALDYLPLALDHAAALCADTGDSFDAYAARLADWIKEAPEGADYPRAVHATFSLAIEKAAAREPQAATLMGLLAFMAPDDFPRDIVPEEVIGGVALGKAVAELRKVSLITVKEQPEGGPLIGVHRLVQLVMRARLAEKGEAETAGRVALSIVTAAFPTHDKPRDVRNWPACERLLPHVITILPNAPDAGEGADSTSQLCNQLALYVQDRADYATAEPLFRRGLAVDEAAYGPDHPRVAIHLNNLAALLQITNRYAEAEPLMRRGLAIDEAAYGSDHPSVATRLNNLAWLLQATNRLAEAEPLMRRALAIDEAAYGPDHPMGARGLNNLALLLKATNRVVEAEPLMRRALAIDEAAYGPDHPMGSQGLNNLASLLLDTNRFAEAEPLMRRALAVDETAYGPDHPEVATDLNNLAALLLATNRFVEAEPLMRRGLAIDEAAYGQDHVKVAIRANNLASLLKATNRPAEAEPLMRRVVEILDKAGGDKQPNFAGALNNLGRLLQDTNRLAEAEPLMRRSVQIALSSLGPDHPTTLTFQRNLNALLAWIGQS